MLQPTTDMYEQILDNLPRVAMRFDYDKPAWTTSYINKAIERYGYSVEEFTRGSLNWDSIVHPDDAPVATKLTTGYLDKGIDNFKLAYRIVTRDGKSIYITDYNHVNRGPDGSRQSIDSFWFEHPEVGAGSAEMDESAVLRHMALNDILLTVQDAKDNPDKAIQFILDRVGSLLDCSRAMLFQDSPDHKTSSVQFEWLNEGIVSIKDVDRPVTYSTEVPEVYTALLSTGVILVDAGAIPENCQKEFEAEGLVSSAIFAVHQYGDQYGFVCFDDCVIARKWDGDTANFLKVVANLLSNVIMQRQSQRHFREYEERIKALAFRDYGTGLPNRYHFESDFADAIIAAGERNTPAHAVAVVLGDNVIHTYGLLGTDELVGKIATELTALTERVFGTEARLYRIGGGVFTVLVQPGSDEPVRAFAEAAAALGKAPWVAGEHEYRCSLNVVAIPFGISCTNPEAIIGWLDTAVVRNSDSVNAPLILSEEVQ